MLPQSETNNFRRPLCSALVCLLSMTGIASAQKEFTQVTPDMIVASKEMADEVRALSCKEADGTWVPTSDQVRIGFNYLRSEVGAAEIKATAPRWLDMSPSLRLISTSRYQVFGLILGGRNQILYHASPKDAKIDWLKQAICSTTFDGGAAFWWAFYDVQSGHFVASSRRP
jgi:hypothetical protein